MRVAPGESGKYLFVSRIAGGDTEKEGEEGRCGTSADERDEAWRSPSPRARRVESGRAPRRPFLLGTNRADTRGREISAVHPGGAQHGRLPF